MNYRKDPEVRAILREQLIDNLIACFCCACVGTLIGFFIGLGMRMHP